MWAVREDRPAEQRVTSVSGSPRRQYSSGARRAHDIGHQRGPGAGFARSRGGQAPGRR
jgi:hypothetical protein